MAESTDTAHCITARATQFRRTCIVINQLTAHTIPAGNIAAMWPNRIFSAMLCLIMSGIIDEYIVQTAIIVRVILRHINT